MKLQSVILVCSLLAASTVSMVSTTAIGSSGQILIIANQQASFNEITERQLRKLYLGKSLKLPNGSRAILGIYNPLKNEFNKRALRRTTAQVDAAWSRLKFSGRAKQPKEFQTPDQVIKFVKKTPNAIAFIPDGTTESDVRTIMRLN